jgi:hypothetical protein
MAAWFTVHCTLSVKGVTAADLTTALAAVDFYTVAQEFGIEDEAVIRPAVSALRVQVVAGELGEWFELRYRPRRYRPLVVYLWTDATRVQRELTEVWDEYLMGRRGRGVTQVRATLPNVAEVVAVELGLGHLEDMGLVIAGQVAEYLAECGKGLIRDTDDEWWIIRQGVPKLLVRGR